jgi:hypothetical protein
MCALSHIIFKAITDDLQQAPEQGLNGDVSMIPTEKGVPEIIRFVDRDDTKLPEFFLPTASPQLGGKVRIQQDLSPLRGQSPQRLKKASRGPASAAKKA